MYLPEEDIFHNVYVDSFKEQKLTSFKHNCDKYWADYKSVIMFSKTIEEINNFKTKRSNKLINIQELILNIFLLQNKKFIDLIFLILPVICWNRISL